MMESRIMGVRFCTLDKLSMTGNSYHDLLIDDTACYVRGGSRDILLSISSNHYVPAIHKLDDTAKTQYVVVFLELVDNSVERRLWKTPRGPPGILQHQTHMGLGLGCFPSSLQTPMFHILAVSRTAKSGSRMCGMWFLQLRP